MANLYRPVSEWAKAIHGADDFEAELSPVDEQDQIAAGHLQIVPSPYEVLSNNFSAGKQGSVVDLALMVEQESALIAGGHIKRAEKPATKKKG